MAIAPLRRAVLAGLAALVAAGVAASGSSSTSSSTSGSSSSSGSDALSSADLVSLETRSGILPWVDPDTPDSQQAYVSSRGDRWELVMSDEFSNPNRNFTPGGDHLWTSLEIPDGTNSALQVYGHNMTTVVCDESDDNGTESVCYMQIEVVDLIKTVTVWNSYSRPPAYQNSTFVRAC